MATLTLQISPELEQRLQQQAEERGVPVSEHASVLLERGAQVSVHPRGNLSPPDYSRSTDYPSFADLGADVPLTDLAENFREYRFGRRGVKSE